MTQIIAKRTQFNIMHPLFNAMKKHKLASTDRLFLLGLFRYMDGNGVAYPSYRTLAEETGLSNKTIANCVKRLSNSGWITYTKGCNALQQSNTYQLNLEMLGITMPDKATVVSITTGSEKKYVAMDGTEFDYPAAMHEHNIHLKNSRN